MSMREGISVYHEGLTEPFESVVIEDGKSLYRVKRGRYGGWREYAGESRVLWSGYRYGKSSGGVDVETFCDIVCGIDMPVPGRYGMVVANWTRIDICGRRPLSAIYQKDKEKNPDLADRLYNSFDYVVRYYDDDETGFIDGRTVGYVVQGGMYADINWDAVLDGSDLEFIEFVGTPSSVEDFLTSRWAQATGRRQDLTSHLWATSVNNPRAWKEAFCEANDAFDVYMSDWVDGADVVLSAAELIAPFESKFGVIAGIRLLGGTRPQLRLLVETPRSMSLEEFAEFMAGPISETRAVIGEDSVRLFIEDISGVSVTPIFHGTMSRYSELLYGRV
jgi:hypothetical protein